MMNEKRKKTLLLIILSLGNFAIGCTFSIQSPFFPREAEKKGASSTEYGFVFGVYQLTFFILAPIYGKLMGHISPNFMLLSGLFLVGGAILLFGFLQDSPHGLPFLILAYVLRIVEGTGSAAYQVSSFSIIAREFRDSVAKTMATLEAALGIGVIVAPTLGGLLYNLGAFLLPFVTLGSFILLCVFITYFILPTYSPSPEMAPKNLLKFWLNFSLIIDATIISTSCMFIGYISAVLEPHLRQFQLSTMTVSVIFVTAGLSYSISAPIWGFICDHKINTKCLSIVGGILLSVSFLLIGPAPFLNIPSQLWLVIFSLAITGIGVSCCYVSPFIGALQDTVHIRGYPEDITTYGLVSSMAGSAQSFGNFIGPSLGGYLLEKIGFSWGALVFAGAEILLVFFLFTYIGIKCCRRKTEEKSYTSLNNDYSSMSS
ncbi:MFS-type transporter SLC18B1-like [Centruroides vittatus]|uniref:MFS-type transporter SLC18B1-like n=1 Tax=Centruroides vittatus TaxID=120091 RepID=UPI00350EC46E